MSAAEELLSYQLLADGISGWEREYRFHPKRKWRFDFAFLAPPPSDYHGTDRPWHPNIAVEVEGGIWTGGAHTRGKHFMSDCEKYNEATLLGWKVLRFTTDMVQDGRALETIKKALKGEQNG